MSNWARATPPPPSMLNFGSKQTIKKCSKFESIGHCLDQYDPIKVEGSVFKETLILPQRGGEKRNLPIKQVSKGKIIIV